MAQQGQSYPSTHIWTDAMADSFHKHVTQLFQKNNEPCKQENYRDREFPSSPIYVLSHEEEQHLADHLAFLACVDEGAKTISAVTLEQGIGLSSLTVRLASNQSPANEVIDGLTDILKIVEEYAHAGRGREEYRSRVFDKVVELSQRRIHARVKSSRWERPPWYRDGNTVPLHVAIQQHLIPRLTTRSRILCGALEQLVQSLKVLEKGSNDKQKELLKTVIRKSYEVSFLKPHRSLESHLQNIGLPERICESRTVLEIDKVTRYLDLSNNLIHHARRAKSRSLFQNIHLESCTSYPGTLPRGAQKVCYVHGEIQLILFYELHTVTPPPRAIGSSKSACFLCDLFIRKQGIFHVSHSHKRLYEQWTIPEVGWMTEKQALRFRNIIQAMDSAMSNLIRTCPKGTGSLYGVNGIESRAHLLYLPPGVPLASSSASITTTTQSDSTLRAESSIQIRTTSSLPSRIHLPSSPLPAHTIFYFRGLPIELEVRSSTLSCVLLVGEVDYIFDVEEVEAGQLLISDGGAADPEVALPELSLNMNFNVRNLPFQSPLFVKGKEGFQHLSFKIHDAGDYSLHVAILWKNRGY